jgi:hypothetical protein
MYTTVVYRTLRRRNLKATRNWIFFRVTLNLSALHNNYQMTCFRVVASTFTINTFAINVCEKELDESSLFIDIYLLKLFT